MNQYPLNDIELCEAFGQWLVDNGYHKTHCFTRSSFHYWATELTNERPPSWSLESASQALSNHRLAPKKGIKRKHNFRRRGYGPTCRWFYAFPKDTPAMTQQSAQEMAQRFTTEAVSRVIPTAANNHTISADVKRVLDAATAQFEAVVNMIEASLTLKSNPDADWLADEVPLTNGS